MPKKAIISKHRPAKRPHTAAKKVATSKKSTAITKSTIPTKSPKLSLREQAMLAPTTQARRLGWFERLSESMQQEMTELIYEWDDGGELRDKYPSRRSIARFFESLDIVPAKISSLVDVVAAILRRRPRD